MKLMICSDLHTNFHADLGKSAIDSLKHDDVDAIVVAGDLSTPSNILKNLIWLCEKYSDVIFVTGNHDYYGATSIDDIDDKISTLSQQHSNLHFLNQSREVVAGVGFIGGTLWFPETPNALLYKAHINDFRYIDKCDPKAFELHESLVDYLANNIEEGDVVVTHHLPSYRSVSSKFIGSNLNCYFASDLDYLVEYGHAAAWIHGHTHTPCDYVLGKTRVCANPFGYPGENPVFNESFIIEV